MTTEPEALLARLVSYPTVSDQSLADLAAHLAERAEDAGFRVERFETAPGKHNVVASAGPEGTDGIALCGHMDVVPVEGQDWSQDPFTLTARGGNLFGRGACDMKGFIAAATVAAGQLPVEKLRREVVLIWTHDEEVGGMGSAALSGQLAGRRLPKATWIGEPTDFKIARFHPGHLAVKIVCHGRAAHSSRPELGHSAINLAGRVLVDLEQMAGELAEETIQLSGQPPMYTRINAGCIHGGTAINIVPERCELDIGLRAPPGVDTAKLLERLRERIAPIDARARDDGGAVTVTALHELPPLLTEPGTPLEVLLRPHAIEETPGGMPFGTDGGNLTRLGCAPLIFGPGSIAVAHRPDEFISRDALRSAAEMIRTVCWKRCIETGA
ncbi:MAG: acetylornithine deacetylase [Myxococcota bacterium]